uniref:Uncharacterized protein n=1 Tax=Loxodonta africana TaxID=9785 RepID=G3UCU4_LOXAF
RLAQSRKCAEARGRGRSPEPRQVRQESREISFLIQQQKSARAAIRLEMFLPPQLKPKRIPDPLDQQEVPVGGEREKPPPPRANKAPARLPAAEASGDYPGGEGGWEHLPALTA